MLHHYTDAQIFAKEEALFTEADLAAGVALSVGGPASDAPAACDVPGGELRWPTNRR